jgi:hypothetical protein
LLGYSSTPLACVLSVWWGIHLIMWRSKLLIASRVIPLIMWWGIPLIEWRGIHLIVWRSKLLIASRGIPLIVWWGIHLIVWRGIPLIARMSIHHRVEGHSSYRVEGIPRIFDEYLKSMADRQLSLVHSVDSGIAFAVYLLVCVHRYTAWYQCRDTEDAY